MNIILWANRGTEATKYRINMHICLTLSCFEITSISCIFAILFRDYIVQFLYPFCWFYCFSMNLIKIHVWDISLKNPRSRITNKIIKVTRLILRTLCIIFYEFLCSIDKNTKNTFSNGLRWFFTLSYIQRESLNYRGKSSVALRQGQSTNKQTEGLSELLVYSFHPWEYAHVFWNTP